MDTTKIIDPSHLCIPAEAMEAFAWNTKLLGSTYTPPLQGEMRIDGSLSAFISADSKAILFFEFCAKNNREGRILNDEVEITPCGNYLLVQVKAYVYIDGVLKGTAVAGQSVNMGCADPSMDLDRVVQYTAGLAKSRALTNAGFGVVSGITVPGANPGEQNPVQPAPMSDSVPFETGNLPGNAPGAYPPGNNAGSPAPQQMPAPAAPQQFPNPNDPSVWARNVVWAKKQNRTMGELLNTSPKDIKWAAESMSMDCEVKRAAVILYPEACRILGVAPKPLR